MKMNGPDRLELKDKKLCTSDRVKKLVIESYTTHKNKNTLWPPTPYPGTMQELAIKSLFREI
jgi:hypothetical protein